MVVHMHIGDLVESKWVNGILGILLEQVGSDPSDIVWRVSWVGENVVFSETCEEQEDLEVVCNN